MTENAPLEHLRENNSFEEEVLGLVNDEEIKSTVPLEQQGSVIMDFFIGSLVRRGTVETSKTTYEPEDILEHMDSISKPEDEKLVTRTEGLRDAVKILRHDPRTSLLFPRTSLLFGGISNLLKVDPKKEGPDKYTLTSLAQIEGYLSDTDKRNRISAPKPGIDFAGSWAPILLDRAEETVNLKAEWIHTGANAMQYSENNWLRRVGNDWEQATSLAERAGVNIELVGRSVESLKSRRKEALAIGHNALIAVNRTRVDDYRNRIERYPR